MVPSMSAILFSYPVAETEVSSFQTRITSETKLAELLDSHEIGIAVAVCACISALTSEPLIRYPDEDSPF
jgi:hypothetical protein